MLATDKPTCATPTCQGDSWGGVFWHLSVVEQTGYEPAKIKITNYLQPISH
ncbi:hypothetical protein B6N60_00078 [Richelia sinica FACHB-800]|uniref:Uncharacterized protein n=1 Tax=Richelia sinica FACHB-800 TaxID=1357546 RepID=A0A975Y2S8_9NOST|nr:hypothetical protein B6N60_00078 [Richelia sinica FACHB-800]